MKEYLNQIKRVALFRGVSEDELTQMLTCLGAEVRRYSREQYILRAGDRPSHIGIVLNGGVHIVKETADGDRILLAALTQGDYFAEALVAAHIQESPVSAVAAEHTCVMLIEFSRIVGTCPGGCTHHRILIENMLMLLARKNLMLQSRIDIVGKRTLRQKILTYLATQPADRTGEIQIPLNREQLADYLCVDRSALSHELARMQQNGEIEYQKNKFRVL